MNFPPSVLVIALNWKFRVLYNYSMNAYSTCVTNINLNKKTATTTLPSFTNKINNCRLMKWFCKISIEKAAVGIFSKHIITYGRNKCSMNALELTALCKRHKQTLRNWLTCHVKYKHLKLTEVLISSNTIVPFINRHKSFLEFIEISLELSLVH